MSDTRGDDARDAQTASPLRYHRSCLLIQTLASHELAMTADATHYYQFIKCYASFVLTWTVNRFNLSLRDDGMSLRSNERESIGSRISARFKDTRLRDLSLNLVTLARSRRNSKIHLANLNQNMMTNLRSCRGSIRIDEEINETVPTGQSDNATRDKRPGGFSTIFFYYKSNMIHRFRITSLVNSLVAREARSPILYRSRYQLTSRTYATRVIHARLRCRR